MSFPGATVDRIDFGKTGRARIRTLFLGLTGPMGPLPLHLTEFAHYERTYAPIQPFGRFLDLITDRFLQFFYRAWADTQPVTHADRPAEDVFAGYLGALGGVPAQARHSAFPWQARIHYLGAFASRRNPAVLQDALSHLLRVPVLVQEFIALSRRILPQDRTRIGRSGAFNRLGTNAVLGGRVRVIDDTVRVRLQVRNMAEYRECLPQGKRFPLVAESSATFLPSQIDWQLQLEIPEFRVEPAKLDGKSQLGWSTWMAPQRRPAYRKDARLGRESGRMVRNMSERGTANE
jgi:type VI secretion system protein ImpH